MLPGAQSPSHTAEHQPQRERRQQRRLCQDQGRVRVAEPLPHKLLRALQQPAEHGARGASPACRCRMECTQHGVQCSALPPSSHSRCPPHGPQHRPQLLHGAVGEAQQLGGHCCIVVLCQPQALLCAHIDRHGCREGAGRVAGGEGRAAGRHYRHCQTDAACPPACGQAGV